jgi:hypothetical protein
LSDYDYKKMYHNFNKVKYFIVLLFFSLLLSEFWKEVFIKIVILESMKWKTLWTKWWNTRTHNVVFVVYVRVNLNSKMRKEFWFTLVVFKHLVLKAYSICPHSNLGKGSLFIGHQNHVLENHSVDQKCFVIHRPSKPCARKP